MKAPQMATYDPYTGTPVRPRRRSWFSWLLVVLLLAAMAGFYYFMYRPLSRSHADLERRLGDASSRNRQAGKRLKEFEARAQELETEQQKLSGELARTVAEKAQLEAELKRVQGELADKLSPEIASGNVTIKRRGNELVVDVADKILFDTGQADVNEGGQKVLAQVGQSLQSLSGYAIQVGGHTDSARVVTPATAERFPTNWELSTARATNVVRFLQERSRIAGERLVAAGFAQFRPAASNASAEGRQKNRRIEIVLLPLRAQSAER